ncbi:cytochrome P450 [Nemania sp. NC0429]|nr:cytochrome P450 [Nemania sp. NC0429]
MLSQYFKIPSALGLIFFSSLLWILSRIGRRPNSYPPGPPTLPLIGNLHLIPTRKRHLQFEKWAREYGEIYSLMLGTKVMIVLSSDRAIKELVDKRGVIYASRPESYIGQDVLSGGLRVLFMPNNSAWKAARKFVHGMLGVTAAHTYIPYQDLENKAMLLAFLEKPNDFIDHLRRYTASLTTQMTFGFRIKSILDQNFKEAFETFDRSSELIGSRLAALLDLVPILRRLPDWLLPIKAEGRQIHERERNLFLGYYQKIKQDVRSGRGKSIKPCICKDLVMMQEKEGFSDDSAAYISGSILQAGSETTASILVGFVQAMVIWPDIAKTAWEELDRICGDRLPDLDDAPHLPYIRACAKESLRWMPGFTLGIPHATTQDDNYLGYHIPKNATVILNVWAVHNDPTRYSSPRQFDPLRYIDDKQTSIEAANNPDYTKRDHFVFGAGRRRCQGMHIADRSLFLAISRLLWAFDFQRDVDHCTGQELVPDMEDLADGIMMFPNPFPAKILPRSMSRAQAVREEWKAMSGLLDEHGQWISLPDELVRKFKQSAE